MAILEEVKISIKEDYLLHYINVYGEKTHDYISKNEFFLKKGKIYGIICEQGAGGEGISHILTDKTCDKSVKIFIDGIETNNISEVSWYVGKNVVYYLRKDGGTMFRFAMDDLLQWKGKNNNGNLFGFV